MAAKNSRVNSKHAIINATVWRSAITIRLYRNITLKFAFYLNRALSMFLKMLEPHAGDSISILPKLPFSSSGSSHCQQWLPPTTAAATSRVLNYLPITCTSSPPSSMDADKHLLLSFRHLCLLGQPSTKLFQLHSPATAHAAQHGGSGHQSRPEASRVAPAPRQHHSCTTPTPEESRQEVWEVLTTSENSQSTGCRWGSRSL